MSSEGQLLAVLVLSSLLAHFLFKLVADRRRRRVGGQSLFPKGPPAWPILGHLPLLQSGCPHHTLAALSGTHGYGPIIGLRLGSHPAVVVSSAALAKDILLNHDKDFASRPRYQFMDSLHYGYDTGVLFSSYSPHWAMLRKIFTLELFTAKRLHELQCVRQEEISRLLNSLLQASSDGTQVVDVGEFVGQMSSDINSRLLRSTRMSDAAPQMAASCGDDSLHSLIKEVEQESRPTLGDFIPWLKWSDVWRKRNMERIHGRFDRIMDTMLLERTREAMKSTTDQLPHDFLQALLSKESSSFHGESQPLGPREIKNSVLDMLAAGIHTTSLTLEWAMAELLRNPRCLHKVREEIDAALGGAGGDRTEAQRLVTDEDLPKLPYLEKVVKEVMRLHPVAPLLLPRISRHECKVGKYVLPQGTHTFVNVWAIGRDPDVWENADEFWPERFEGGNLESVDVRGQDYELLPFGSGRRMCPAVRLALALVQGTLANLVHAFAWELPSGQTPQSVDMTEKRGITSGRASPLLAIPKPRSGSGQALYELYNA